MGKQHGKFSVYDMDFHPYRRGKQTRGGQYFFCRFPLELLSNDKLPYVSMNKDDHISLIHNQKACSRTSQSWHDFVLPFDEHDSTSTFGPGVIEITTYIYFILDVYFFWFVTKLKERFHGIDEFIKWLHWIYDFILTCSFS